MIIIVLPPHYSHNRCHLNTVSKYIGEWNRLRLSLSLCVFSRKWHISSTDYNSTLRLRSPARCSLLVCRLYPEVGSHRTGSSTSAPQYIAFFHVLVHHKTEKVEGKLLPSCCLNLVVPHLSTHVSARAYRLHLYQATVGASWLTNHMVWLRGLYQLYA